MRWLRPMRAAALVVALALLLVPSAARADGDPASDILLIQDTFFPYQFKVAPNIQTAVNTAVARAKAAGFPLKVAIVSAATDLGADPNFFAKPQQYADFLDKEISFNKEQLLLVVMPQGFGVSHAGSPSVLAGTKIPPGSGADPLGRAALPAIGLLARQAGHPITLPKIGAASGSGGGGTPALLTFGAPLGLILIVGVVLIFRGRSQGREIPTWDDEDDDDDDDEDVDDEADGPPPKAPA